MTVLSFEGNALTRTIPEEWRGLTKFEIIEVSRNQLVGTVLYSLFYNLTDVVIFLVANNKLHGNIPADATIRPNEMYISRMNLAVASI